MRRGILLPLSAGPRIKRCKQTSPPFLPPAVKAPSCLRLRFGVVRVSSEGAQGGWKFGVSALPPEPRRRREGCALPGGAEPCGAVRGGLLPPRARTGARLQTPPEFAETCEREEAAALITCK